ncbi:MAG: hypothetical protein NTV94_18655, partial [Planctomycetota bacterium]|nr:hypothetical protein [Planctomycetota bacterium]
RAAMHGEFDVVAVSSVAYPLLADQYWILSVGSSVGRGYGPVLVSKDVLSIAELAGKRVGVASKGTTGGTLARMYCPQGTIFKELPYDRIAEGILRGELDAGVMIHEELVHYPAMGLRRVEDLGGLWTQRTGLPLPVGLNLVKKSVGREDAVRIAGACRDSLLWSLEHTQEAMNLVGGMGRSCAAQFVPMFSNADTLCMPRDVRQSLAVLFDRLSVMGWAPALSQIEVIDA